jgi:hypothetical protein
MVEVKSFREERWQYLFLLSAVLNLYAYLTKNLPEWTPLLVVGGLALWYAKQMNAFDYPANAVGAKKIAERYILQAKGFGGQASDEVYATFEDVEVRDLGMNQYLVYFMKERPPRTIKVEWPGRGVIADPREDNKVLKSESEASEVGKKLLEQSGRAKEALWKAITGEGVGLEGEGKEEER